MNNSTFKIAVIIIGLAIAGILFYEQWDRSETKQREIERRNSSNSDISRMMRGEFGIPK